MLFEQAKPLVFHEFDLAFGPPGVGFDLGQFLLAAQGFDAFIDDGFRVVRRPSGLAERESQCRHQSRQCQVSHMSLAL